MRGVADVVGQLGYGNVARRLMQCGVQSDVYTCESCGDPYAAVEVPAGCDVRACPWCARKTAQEETARVSGAAARLADLLEQRAPARAGVLYTELRELEARELSSRRRSRVRSERIAAIKRAGAAIRRRGSWGWKLLTITPQWSPSDPAAYSVAGLRARLESARERWARLWSSGLDCGGLAAAYLSIELSAGGHVHAHVLYHGPFIVRSWAAEVAGCFVDVRAIRGNELRKGVKEAVKYVLKGPSPARAWWVAGARNRTPHVRLAGAWVVATRGRRLTEPYGLMREALHIHDEMGGSTAPNTDLRACASCGSCDLSEPRREATAVVANALRHRWRFHPTRAPEMSVLKGLPARITIVRAVGEARP